MVNKEIYNEKTLITKLKHGDEKSFLYIYNKYSKVLWSFLQKLKVEKDDIEEVVQQTFMKLWEKRASLDEEQSIKSYIITIAKNDIYNKVKHRIIHKKYEDSLIKHESACADSTNRELTEVLYKILESLPEKRRKVFELSRIQGYTNQEIANELNISKSTVENHINNSSSYIKKMLKSLGFTFIFLTNL